MEMLHQPVAQHQDSYFKDTFELKQLLDGMELPPNAMMFTLDATSASMYTNIQTEQALAEIAKYLRDMHGSGLQTLNTMILTPLLLLSKLFSKKSFQAR